MNNIQLTGRTTRDIELRYTPAGKAVANGTIAVQRKFKNQNGDYEADFIDFVAWGKTGELMAEYVQKGDHFGISGNIQTRSYQNNEGKNIKVVEVNVQDFDFPVKQKQGQSAPQNSDPFDGTPVDIDDENLPF